MFNCLVKLWIVIKCALIMLQQASVIWFDFHRLKRKFAFKNSLLWPQRGGGNEETVNLLFSSPKEPKHTETLIYSIPFSLHRATTQFLHRRCGEKEREVASVSIYATPNQSNRSFLLSMPYWRCFDIKHRRIFRASGLALKFMILSCFLALMLLQTWHHCHRAEK